MTQLTEKFYYECVNCGREYDNSSLRYLCPDCSKHQNPEDPPKGVLKVRYPYKEIKKKNPTFKQLKTSRFLDLYPIQSLESFPPLRVGQTPFYKISELDGQPLDAELFLKDDSQNPTYSFKDRASTLVSAFAKEHKLNVIITASTGNAGSSLAGICASAGQKAIVIVPEKAPLAKLTQIIMYGAKIVPVKGTYDDAFDLSVEATKKFGWYNRNTAFNPLTIEGKKSVAFELFDQMGEKVPDRIFVPVGDGVIMSGVYKGFEDLLALGLIDKMPVIVAVQSSGSDNLVRNAFSESFILKESNTIADSISVDIPRNFCMAKQFLQKYDGEALTVEDDAILKASKNLSVNTGLFSEPAAATAFAGFQHYRKNNKLPPKSLNVVLLTGSGLKDLSAVQHIISIPEAIEPVLSELQNLIS
jgi:threonine synthase